MNKARMGAAPWHGHSPSAGGWRDTAQITALALLLRLAIAGWASSRFPPADDGSFYHVVAQRIAEGAGYTWLWPDGAVTYAAHYPIGYPALLAAAYWLVNSSPLVAMSVNAVLGALGVLACHRLLYQDAGSRLARFGALAVALHPTLLFYTPALMTEGVVGALLAMFAWVALAKARFQHTLFWLLALGVLGGFITLMRPQSLLFVPVFAFVGASGERLRMRLGRSFSATLVAIVVCLPWTFRNCAKMERCVFVSANGGWNLLIGTSEKGHGGFIAVDKMGVPEKCRTVFQEAEKDACFGAAGIERIGASPVDWLLLVPSKLGTTFNYATPAASYLGGSNSQEFSSGSQTLLGGLELLSTRVVMAAAILAIWRRRSRRRLTDSIAGLGLVALITPWAWLGALCLAVLGNFGGSRLAQLTGSTVGLTAVTHAVFFGAPRYAMVCLPLMIALAAWSFTRPEQDPERALANSP